MTSSEILFTEWVRQYAKDLYTYARKILIVHADADDIVQETFLKAWKSIDQFEGRSNPKTWLIRITHNCAIDFLRKQKTQLTSLDSDWVNHIQSDPYFDSSTIELELENCISKLTEYQQLVFRMRYYSDLSFAEIAEIQGKTENAVKVNYHKSAQYIKTQIILSEDLNLKIHAL